MTAFRSRQRQPRSRHAPILQDAARDLVRERRDKANCAEKEGTHHHEEGAGGGGHSQGGAGQGAQPAAAWHGGGGGGGGG